MPEIDGPPPAARWLPGLLALGAIWGSSFLFIKVGVSALPPLYVSGTRVASGAVTLLLVMLIGRIRLPRSPALWADNCFIGVVGVAMPFSLFAYGEQRIPSLLAGIWNSMTPLVVLPMAVLAFRTERFTIRRLVGVGLGLLGALVILAIWNGIGGAGLAGQLMCLAAASCYGIAIPYTKRFISGSGVSAVSLTAIQLLTATVVLAIVAAIVAGPPPSPSSLPLSVIGSVVVLGAVGTALAFLINMRNIRLVGASTASLVTYIVPIFATVIGVVGLGEPLHWHQPVGAAIVLVGVAISQGVIRLPVGRRSRDGPQPVSTESAVATEPAGPVEPGEPAECGRSSA